MLFFWKSVRQSLLIFIVLFLWNLLSSAIFAENNSPAKSEVPAVQSGISLVQAVQVTLDKQPEVLLQQQDVVISQGALQAESGEFDAALTSSFNFTHSFAQENSDTAISTKNSISETKLGIQKKTRYGISFGPNIDMIRSHGVSDPLVTTDSNNANVYFNLNVPLLKGWGRDATGAQEMAAAVEFDASLLDLENTLALSVKHTTVAYWNYLEAQMQFKILKKMEEDARLTLTNMKQLVKGDDRPPSDLHTFEADLADKISQRIAMEQNIFEAQQELGLAMGLSYRDIDALPLPVDSFPDPRTDELSLLRVKPNKLFKKARNKRADYLALKKREAAAKILLAAASNSLLPQLDLSGSIGYSGFQDGENLNDYLKSLSNNLTGANYSAGIILTFPFGNNEAKGQHLEQRSRLRKIVIEIDDLDRRIHSGIVVAFQAIERSSRELKETRRSVKHYQTAVSDEKIKFGMGMASVLDIVNIQNFLRNTMLNEVIKMKNYATAVVNLRYQTGTLITSHGDGYRVETKQLISPSQPSGETR